MSKKVIKNTDVEFNVASAILPEMFGDFTDEEDNGHESL